MDSKSPKKRSAAAVSDSETPVIISHKGAEAKNGASSSSRGKRTKTSKHGSNGTSDKLMLSAKDVATQSKTEPIEVVDDEAGPSSSTATSSNDDASDEQECAGLLSSHTNGDELHARVRQLEAELQSAKESLKTKDSLVTSQQAVFQELQASCSCQICLDLVWRPCVLAPCGHTFCIRCLQSWFTKPLDSEAAPSASWSAEAQRSYLAGRTLKRKKICPSCRTELACAPVEIWLVREILEKVQGALKAAVPEAVLPAPSQEDVQRQKGDDLPAASKIWTGIFDTSGPRRVIFDEVDRVPRCGACAAEIDDYVCTNCGIEYDSDESALRRGDDWDSEDSDDFSSYGPLGREAMMYRAQEAAAERNRVAGTRPADGEPADYFDGGSLDEDDTDYSDGESDDMLPGPRRANLQDYHPSYHIGHRPGHDEPIQIIDDSDDARPSDDSSDDLSDDASAEMAEVLASRRRYLHRLQRSGFVDDEAEDDEDDEDEEDEDDFIDDGDEEDLGEVDEEDDVDFDTRSSSATAARKAAGPTDAARSRARRIIADSDEE